MSVPTMVFTWKYSIAKLSYIEYILCEHDILSHPLPFSIPRCPP